MSTITGTNNNDTLNGTSGADSISGLNGDDSINAGDGADTIVGGNGNDTVHAGAGADVITVGRGDTLYGEDDNDTFNWTDIGYGVGVSADGGSGVDRLNVDLSAATDSINSYANAIGSGNIAGLNFYNMETLSIIGGSASDTLAAGSGNDTLRGGGGNDRLDAGSGSNVIDGGSGVDIGLIDLSATGAAINVNFTGANITIGGTQFTAIEGLGVRAGSAADTVNLTGELRGSEIYAGADNDSLTGGASYSDYLNGEDNNDTIVFGRGDTVYGGAGDDILKMTEASSSGLSASVDGQGDNDELILNFSAATDAISSYANATGSGSFGGINFYNIEVLSLTGGSASDVISGGSGADTLAGGKGNDRIDGGAGANHIDGGAGIDTAGFDLSATSTGLNLKFKAGDVTIGGNVLTSIEGLVLTAGTGGDAISVAQEQTGSRILGGDGNDSLTGSANYADYLDGGNDKDSITFGIGDTVYGGAGDDSLRITGASGSGISVDGQGDNDTLTADFSSAFDSLTAYANSTGSGSFGGMNFYNIEQVHFTGGSASDTVAGGAGDDTLSGGGGNDRVDGGLGVNLIDGGSGIDIGVIDLSNTSAAINVNFDTSIIRIAGNKLSNVEGLGISGGTGADVINVSGETRGSDLHGGGGADTITGGAAIGDTLDGGADNDLIFFNTGDTVYGGAGADSLRITTSQSSGLGGSIDGQADTDTLIANLSTATGNVYSYGNSTGSGSIAGFNYYNIEQINLLTGSGNDTLVGSDGNDTLTGNLGADSITGGAGNDRYIYGSVADSTVALSGRDRIVDFLNGDKIDLSAIDANTKGSATGDQAFTFVAGATSFTAAGQLISVINGSVTTISGDVNGDGVADFAIDLTGAITMHANDFVL